MLLDRLTARHCQPEIMDQPGLSPDLHRRALAGLARINWLSASDAILWPSIRDLARARGGTLRVLDVACGGGDVPVRLWQRARRAGITLHILGVDKSATAIEQARLHARRRQADVAFEAVDVLAGELPAGFDVVTCSLFLHHLQREEALALLRALGRAAGSLVLVNDLIRCRTGYALAYLGTRLLSRSNVVHVDGPRSVEAAFTRAEVLSLAEEAGWDGATAVWHYPWRFLLSWRRP